MTASLQDLLRQGTIVSGLDPESRNDARRSLAAWAADSAQSLHILTESAQQAADVFADLRAKHPSARFALLDGPACITGQEDGYSSPVVVGALESFAIDYLWDTLHGEPSAPLQGRRDLALVDDAERVLVAGAAWNASVASDEFGCLDRIAYADFVSTYRNVSGVTERIAPRPAEDLHRRYGWSVVDGFVSTAEVDTPERSQRWRRLRRASSAEPRESAVAEQRRFEVRVVERNQRANLVDYRRRMIEKLSTLNGICAVLARWLVDSSTSRDQDRRDRALALLQKMGSPVGDPGDGADLTRLEPKVIRALEAQDEEALRSVAHETAVNGIPAYWRVHLEALDSLQHGLWGAEGLGGDLAVYAENAYVAYEEMIWHFELELMSSLVALRT